MAAHEAGIRDRIIDATIELITKYGDTSMITIRGIAAKAGVGVAMINYHFEFVLIATGFGVIYYGSATKRRYPIERI